MNSLIKSLRRRFGISAPRVTVRTHLAWYWRWLGMIPIAVFGYYLAVWVYDAGSRYAGFDSSEVQVELAQLRRKVSELEQEVAKLRSNAGAADARLKVEQSAQSQLAAQIKQFAQENTRLKEDLAFFEGLGPSGAKDDRLSIHRFTVQPGAIPGEYRYRLLVSQGSRRNQAFQGSIQLWAELQDKGRDAMIRLTGEGIAENGIRPLNFKFFNRVEGTFRLQPSMRIRSVQVRIFENGSSETRAVEDVSLI